MHFSFYDKSDRPHTSVTFLAKKAVSFIDSLADLSPLFTLLCLLPPDAQMRAFFPFQVFKSDSHWSSESAWWINIWFADIPWQHYKHCESHRRPINLESELKDEKQAFKHAPQSWKCPHNNEFFLKPWISIHLWGFLKKEKSTGGVFRCGKFSLCWIIICI